MDDERYVFFEHQKETKALARSARHRIVGSRTRTVRLTSDYLTPAEIKRRNGPMSTYEMARPHTLKELRTWPKDLQRQYMERIMSMYNPQNWELGDMLECHWTTACRYRKSLGLTDNVNRKSRNKTKEQQEAWEEFINAGAPEIAEEEPVDDIPAADPPPVKTTECIPELVFDKARLTFTGTYQDLVRLAADPPPVKTTECIPELVFDKVRLTFTGTYQDLVRLLVTLPPMPASDQVYEFYISADRKEPDSGDA